MSKKIDRRINGEDIVEKEFGDFLENGTVLGGGGLIKGFPNGIILGKEGVEESKIQTLHYGGYNAFAPTHSRAVDLGLNTNAWKSIWVGNASRNENGYTTLPNGMILQWGSFYSTNIPLNVWTKFDVTFPITFPNMILSTIVTTNAHSRGNARGLTVELGNVLSQSSFEVWVHSANSGWGGAMWIALGY